MSDVLPLMLKGELDTLIRRAGEGAYPEECCGVLYGRDVDGRRIVEAVEAVENSFEAGEKYHRFSITGEVLMRAEKRAAVEGRLVVGFYHSHPDHPARPSEFDREHGWPFYSYVIVAVAGSGGAGSGRSGELTSWVLSEVTEQFQKQDVKVI